MCVNALLPDHAAAHDRDQNIGVGERRDDQRVRDISRPVRRFVEMNVELVRIARAPARIARSGNVELARRFRLASDVAPAVFARMRYVPELGGVSCAPIASVAVSTSVLATVLLRDALFGRVAAFDDGGRGEVGRELQLEMHLRLRHRSAVRVECDHGDLRRLLRRRDEIRLKTDLYLTRKCGERFAIADGEIRDVGRIGHPPDTSSDTGDRPPPARRATRAARVDRNRLL